MNVNKLVDSCKYVIILRVFLWNVKMSPEEDIKKRRELFLALFLLSEHYLLAAIGTSDGVWILLLYWVE